MAKSYRMEKTMHIATRTWKVIIVGDPDEFQPDNTFVILGAVLLLVACILLALWLTTNHGRQVKYARLLRDAQAEKASLLLDHARQTALREREMNDFIAHEIRNPLSAALSATSFVATEVHVPPGVQPLATTESQVSCREDLQIVHTSLQFINDLLRNMLDMHRANANQLQLQMQHVDVARDILQPVASMLYARDADFVIQVTCEPDHLVISADPLRLRQIVLNLARNSVKVRMSDEWQ